MEWKTQVECCTQNDTTAKSYSPLVKKQSKSRTPKESFWGFSQPLLYKEQY